MQRSKGGFSSTEFGELDAKVDHEEIILNCFQSYFIFKITLSWGEKFALLYFPTLHFTDEKTKAQRGHATAHETDIPW